LSAIKPYDEDEDSYTDIFYTWCLWDTDAQRADRRVMPPLLSELDDVEDGDVERTQQA